MREERGKKGEKGEGERMREGATHTNLPVGSIGVGGRGPLGILPAAAPPNEDSCFVVKESWQP